MGPPSGVAVLALPGRVNTLSGWGTLGPMEHKPPSLVHWEGVFWRSVVGALGFLHTLGRKLGTLGPLCHHF